MTNELNYCRHRMYNFNFSHVAAGHVLKILEHIDKLPWKLNNDKLL